MNNQLNILFLGELHRADAQSWYKGIEMCLGQTIEKVEIRPQRYRCMRIIAFAQFMFKLICSSKKYDIVLAERTTSYGFLTIFVNAKVRAIAQQGITDTYPENGFSGFYKAILKRTACKYATIIHAWGHAMVPSQLKAGAHPAKIKVKPKGINLKQFTYRDKITDFKPIAIVTRSLYEEYRHEDILQAVHLLQVQGIILEVYIIGDGPKRNELIQLCKQLQIEDKIHFIGRVPNDQLPEYLNKASIYLSVPETEGVSSSLFEAMACGCIPIVTHLPGNIPFIQPGINGELVKVKNPESLALALAQVINKPEHYKKGVERNRDFIEKEADWHKNMQYFTNLYLNLLNQK